MNSFVLRIMYNVLYWIVNDQTYDHKFFSMARWGYFRFSYICLNNSGSIGKKEKSPWYMLYFFIQNWVKVSSVIEEIKYKLRINLNWIYKTEKTWQSLCVKWGHYLQAYIDKWIWIRLCIKIPRKRKLQ